jgi:hypothetical protein
MNNFIEIFNENFNIIAIGLFLISLIFSIVCLIRLRSLNKKYSVFMKALSGKDVESLLLEHMENVNKVIKENSEIKENIKEINNTLKPCFQKYGIVRYTAFDDVGSDLSFAIALLDGKDDGVLLNGVYSREGSSVYAKPIYNGTTKYTLSDEEQKALENAKRRGQIQ